MTKFIISWWMGLAVASSAIAFLFWDAICKNQNPTGEQLASAWFLIVFFAVFAFACVLAHVENIIYKNKKN